MEERKEIISLRNILLLPSFAGSSPGRNSVESAVSILSPFVNEIDDAKPAFHFEKFHSLLSSGLRKISICKPITRTSDQALMVTSFSIGFIFLLQAHPLPLLKRKYRYLPHPLHRQRPPLNAHPTIWIRPTRKTLRFVQNRKISFHPDNTKNSFNIIVEKF